MKKTNNVPDQKKVSTFMQFAMRVKLEGTEEARITLTRTVTDLFNEGRITQEVFDRYMNLTKANVRKI